MPSQNELAELNLPAAEVQSGGDGITVDTANPPANGDTGAANRKGPSSRDKTAVTAKAPATQEEVHQPFILSEGLAPVPAKLVAKILRGEFVDMAELLRDNLEALRRGSLQDPMTGDATPAKRLRREIPDLLSWVQCFGTFMAVVASQHPVKLRQLLAYQTIIVREARRCGGKGWLAYDTMFRQQVAGDDKADWSKLNSSLYAVSFLAQSGKGRSCTLCMEADHAEEECALARPTTHDFKQGGGHAVRQPPSGSGNAYGSRFPRGREKMVCMAFNQGDCAYMHCKYSHSCMKCGSRAHPVIRCLSSGVECEGARRSGRDWRPPSSRDATFSGRGSGEAPKGGPQSH